MLARMKGIHRKIGVSGAPNSAWISDGTTGEFVNENEYRARGYAPEFDSLPILIVQRVPVTEAPVSPDDMAFVKTMGQNDA